MDAAKKLRAQFADTLLALGQEDPALVVLIGDISHFILQPFAQACPGRFYNVGICEPTLVGMGAGLAKAGFRPVIHTIAPFLIERSFEQLKLDFCYQKLGGNLVTVGSAFDYGTLGCTHHCYGDWALLKTLPGTRIIHPGSAHEFDVLFRQIYADAALNVFRLPEQVHGASLAGADLKVGQAIRLREGRNLTILTTGSHLRDALDALPTLEALGWDAEVLHLHTLRPLDMDRIRASATKTRRVVVVEEHMRTGGLFSDVVVGLRDVSGLAVCSLAIPDAFITDYGSWRYHCEGLGLTPDGLIQAVSQTFGRP